MTFSRLRGSSREICLTFAPTGLETKVATAKVFPSLTLQSRALLASARSSLRKLPRSSSLPKVEVLIDYNRIRNLKSSVQPPT